MTQTNETTQTTFRVSGLPGEVLEAARSGGADARGNVPVRMVADGGEPVRCCLQDARAGEGLVLFGYAPPLPESPTARPGRSSHISVSVRHHPRTATPPTGGGRPQVLRAYDARGWIHPATRTHDGTDPEAAVAAVLAEPGVVQVHSRNIAYGCWMFTAVAA